MGSPTSIIVSLLAVLFLCSLPGQGLARHGQVPKWLDGMRDGENTSCCGNQDCIHVASIQILGEQNGMSWIAVDGNMFQIYPKSLIKVPCDLGAYVCLQNGITEDNQEKPCAWINNDGTLGIRQSPKCFKCAVAPDCPLS